jgi:hypothetical protein
MYAPRLFLKDLWNSIPLGISLAAQAASWWYVFEFIRPAGEQAFLHYNSVFGVDLVGPWWKIIYAPLAGLGIIVLNYVLGWWIYPSDRFLSRLLSFFAAICQLGMLLSLYLLVVINS